MDVPGRKPQDGNDEPSLLCDPCKGENDDMPAVSYCTVCNDYLCHGCRKAHTRAKDSRDHNLMEQDSMPKQKPTNSDESECPKHINKALEYYCKTDDRFCCSVCATIDHKQCSIKYIDDVALDFNRSNEYAGLEKTITDLIRLLQKTKDISTRNNKNIETTHANFISDLKQFRTEINNKLDSLEKAALREAKIARDSEKKTVDSIATTCDSMLSDMSKLSTKLKALNTYKQERQLVICSKKAAKTVNTYGYKVNELSKQNKVKDYHFQPNEKIRHFLYSLDSVGHMNDGNDDGEIKGHAMGPVVYSSTSGQPVASHVRNIDTRHTTDRKGYWMTGV